MTFAAYHIGARDGTREFPTAPAFDECIYSVLFDGDSNCIEKIQQSGGKRQEVHAFVIAGKDAPANFHHTKCPYATSLLQQDKGTEEWNLFLADHDYVIREALSTVRVEPVNARSLDSLLCRELASSPPPDFLSMDAQGSELDILTGALEALDSSVIGCVSEVEFQRLYENQPLFGDVCSFLTDRGFWFVGFDHILDLSPYRYPIGLRGRGFNLTCNALFLKKPEAAAKGSPGALAKLAFCAILYNCFEVAWKCFETGGFNVSSGNQEDGPLASFIHGAAAAYFRHPKIYPLSFSERATKAPIRIDSGHPEQTEMELLFKQWGLHSQAAILKENRVKQECFASNAALLS